jgi:hypothetical protein
LINPDKVDKSVTDRGDYMSNWPNCHQFVTCMLGDLLTEIANFEIFVFKAVCLSMDVYLLFQEKILHMIETLFNFLNI